MQTSLERFVAVDWSGAQSVAEQRRRIVIADWDAGRITLSAGRTREEVAAWLIEQSARTPAMVVGMDFSFSLAAWFVGECGASTIEDFWRYTAQHAEKWLNDCDPPFWGRAAKHCPPDHRGPDWLGYRRCEVPSVIGWQPKSTFQIGGAGAVGTGSLRGVATLLALRRAGFSVWPFHAVKWPCVVEIYPRSFTGAVRKSSEAARASYLQSHLTDALSDDGRKLAIESEDAFDALCSVIGMARQRGDFLRLEQASDPLRLLEGDIFPGRPISSPGE
jgi:hypothetical protein